MRPFLPRHIDGSPNTHTWVEKKSSQRSKRANGSTPSGTRRNSAEARRLKELIEGFGTGLEPLDEPKEAIVRGAALMAQQLEKLEERVTRGEDIDEMRLQRLSNSLTRSILALNTMRPKPKASEQPQGSNLQRHLAAMVERREKARLEAEALAAAAFKNVAEGPSAIEP